MAGQIIREELLAAQQNKSPKKPHLKLTEKYDICCLAEESPLSQAERWPAPWSRRRTFWELEEKVDKKKQKEVELQEIITPSFINEVIY